MMMMIYVLAKFMAVLMKFDDNSALIIALNMQTLLLVKFNHKLFKGYVIIFPLKTCYQKHAQ